MKTHAHVWVLPASLLTYLAIFGVHAWTQTTPEIERSYEHLIYPLKGPDLFRAHCAPCHGLDGKGAGPVGASLKSKPADLTMLARSNGGKFPSDRVRKLIAGENMSASHGSREMPVWGPIFHQVEEDRDYGNVRLENLTKYVESIQQKH